LEHDVVMYCSNNYKHLWIHWTWHSLTIFAVWSPTC
jgi:hypothetical protein